MKPRRCGSPPRQRPANRRAWRAAEARVNAERDRLAAYQNLPSTVLLGMAAREMAANLGKVEHLYLTPDLLGPLAARFLDGTGGPRQADAAERWDGPWPAAPGGRGHPAHRIRAVAGRARHSRPG